MTTPTIVNGVELTFDGADRYLLACWARRFPGCAVSGRGDVFMIGSSVELGFVPNDWNGESVRLEPPGPPT